MARIVAAELSTPHGDTDASLRALLRADGRPGTLPGELLSRLRTLAERTCGGTAPDLLLLATTKGDCARYAHALVGEATDGDGGPAWLARELTAALGCPAMVVSAACASGPTALGEAGRRIHAGLAARVLVLGGDRLAPFVSEGFASLRAIDPDGCRPFDAERAGLSLGEADAAVLLDGEATGLQLQGWGASLDARHLTAPDPEGRGLELAARRACARAGIGRAAWICGHGTGTVANDAAELGAYCHLGWDVPVVGWKGLLGHGLGSNGLAEVALIAHILRADAPLPGTAAMRKRADSRVLGPGPHPRPAGAVLSTNAGFGGLNAAVVLGDSAPLPVDPVAASVVVRSAIEAEDGELPRRGARAVLGHADVAWGRLDRPCRLLVELVRALGELHPDTALVLLSDSGCLLTDRGYERARLDQGAEPQRFVYTLPSIPVGEASIRCGLRGPGFALQVADDETGRTSARLLLADGAPAVVVARIEELDQPRAWAELWRPDGA